MTVMEYEVQRCTRRCAATDRELVEGEEFYSTLIEDQGELRRLDYSVESWTGPPTEAIGWWKARMPERNAAKARLAPNEVLLELFGRLADDPTREDLRFVLALLLVRRRVLRQEDTERDELAREVLVLYCGRDESTHRVASAAPNDERIEQIQAELGRLLFAQGE